MRDPTLTIAGEPVIFPVAVNEGDRLVFRGMDDCRLFRKSGTVEEIAPGGSVAKLKPGQNPVVFSLPSPSPREFRVVVTLVKVYGTM